MPKIKTHKATAKRFKVTGSGKLRRRKGHASHLRRKKSKRAERELKGNLSVSKADRGRVKRMLSLKRALKDDFTLRPR
ncbi:MAG TPA: 50S ribosomal protein L35 [Chloroflexi bacterium]|nr:50S ribosomal protein L35 [Chloroflexota bacterium]